MLNKDNEIREYAFVDPEKLKDYKPQPYNGTDVQCLADGILDIIQVALDRGMTQEQVDDAMKIIIDTLAVNSRSKFRIHIRDKS